MGSCRICNVEVDASLLVDTCPSCRAQIAEYVRVRRANAPPPATVSPPLRPRLPCEDCAGTVFVRGHSLRDLTIGKVGTEVVSTSAPLAITFDRGPFGGMGESAYGVLESYTCRGCGKVELYVREPDRIPIGPQYGTELFDVTPGRGGYRT